MFLPSSMIMVGFDALWDRFQASPWRTVIAHGLTPAVVGWVWASVVTIGRGAPASADAYGVTAVVVLLSLRTKIGTPLLILLSGAVGVAALR